MKRIFLKKTVSLFLAVIVAILCIPMAVVKTDATTEGRYTYIITDDGAVITKVDIDSRGEITVPDRLGGYDVTRIGNEAFRGCEYIYSIIIPESVTTIGIMAFYKCTRLKRITVAEDNIAYRSVDGVLFTKDGENLVCYPAGKEDAEYSVPDSVKAIGGHAFAWCNGLERVAIPDSVASIGAGAFYYCKNISDINIPQSVTVIETTVFFGCSGITDISIPEGVTEIHSQAFSYCTGITAIVIPDSITKLGNAFMHCTALGNIAIPDHVIDIDRHVIYGTAYYNDLSNWDHGVLYLGKHLLCADETIKGDYSVKEDTVNIANYAF